MERNGSIVLRFEKCLLIFYNMEFIQQLDTHITSRVTSMVFRNLNVKHSFLVIACCMNISACVICLSPERIIMLSIQILNIYVTICNRLIHTNSKKKGKEIINLLGGAMFLFRMKIFWNSLLMYFLTNNATTLGNSRLKLWCKLS